MLASHLLASAIDHHNAECVGIHAVRRGTRFEALEPLRQGVRRHFGAIGKDVACGFSVHHDHGSQYMSDTFQTEMRFLGIQSSPAFVRAPEGNGCAERFIHTLKENLLWIRTFGTVEDLRLALLAFRDTYNTTWLVQRLGYRSPDQVRQDQLSAVAIAAQAPHRCLINRRQYRCRRHVCPAGETTMQAP